MIDRTKAAARRARSSGMALVGVITALLVMMILVPAMVFYVQTESRQTLKQKRATLAFYAASAGVDRALWKLRSDATAFDEVLDGGTMPAGYAGDVTYVDISSAAYRITLSSTSVAKQVRVEAWGRDNSLREYRAIEVLLSRSAISAALYAPSITTAGSAKIFWGPMMAQTSIAVTGSSNELYPRKFARGAITAAGSYPTRDSSSAAPNTDGLEWWSYNEPPGVPDAPAIDLEYYKAQSKLETGCPAGGTPAGSCYYTSNKNISNLLSMTSKVYYFEQDASFAGSKHFRGVLVVMGDLSITGSGKGVDGGNEYGNYIATVPATAYLEYQKNTPKSGDNCLGVGGLNCGGGGNGAANDNDYNDTNDAERDDDCCHQYPGDRGTASTETYKVGGGGCLAHGNDGGASTEPISFKGFIWAAGNSSIAGSAAIHGAFMSNSGSFTGSGSFTIFYDASLDIEVTGPAINQTSWRELPGKSF